MTARTTQLGGVQKQANLVLSADWFFFAREIACLISCPARSHGSLKISQVSMKPQWIVLNFWIFKALFFWFSWILLICHSLFTRRLWRISTRVCNSRLVLKSEEKAARGGNFCFCFSISHFTTAAADYSQLFSHCSLFASLSRISRTSSS